MAEIINLNRQRKARARAAQAAKAQENRIRHGRTKAEKARDAEQQARVDRELSGKQREDDAAF